MKRIRIYKDEEITAYNDKDLESFEKIILQAAELWRNRCNEYLEKNGDLGTCVLGAGFEVHYLAPRCRKPQYKSILSASTASNCQGASVWESSKDEIMAFFKANGIEVHYDCGK